MKTDRQTEVNLPPPLRRRE